jgi:hypothetical protein
VESHVVDPASIATSRRRRRTQTDRLDGEALLRALLAFKRGEPRVCAMAVPPTPEEEDRRRLNRERRVLVIERSFGLKDCFVVSTIAGKSRPTPGWRQRHGKAARSATNRASRKQASRASGWL